MREVAQACFEQGKNGLIRMEMRRLIDDEVLLEIQATDVVRRDGFCFLYWPYASAQAAPEKRWGLVEIAVAPEHRELDDGEIRRLYAGRRGFVIYPDMWCRVFAGHGHGLEQGLIQPGLPVPLNEFDVVLLARGQQLQKHNSVIHQGMLQVTVQPGRLYRTDAPIVTPRPDGSVVLHGGTYAFLAGPDRRVFALHQLAAPAGVARDRIHMAAVEAVLEFLEVPPDRHVEIFDVLWSGNTSARRRERHRRGGRRRAEKKP